MFHADKTDVKKQFFAKASKVMKHCAGDKIEKNEMGKARGTYGGRERCAQGFGGETRGKETIGETKT